MPKTMKELRKKAYSKKKVKKEDNSKPAKKKTNVLDIAQQIKKNYSKKAAAKRGPASVEKLNPIEKFLIDSSGSKKKGSLVGKNKAKPVGKKAKSSSSKDEGLTDVNVKYFGFPKKSGNKKDVEPSESAATPAKGSKGKGKGKGKKDEYAPQRTGPITVTKAPKGKYKGKAKGKDDSIVVDGEREKPKSEMTLAEKRADYKRRRKEAEDRDNDQLERELLLDDEKDLAELEMTQKKTKKKLDDLAAEIKEMDENPEEWSRKNKIKQAEKQKRLTKIYKSMKKSGSGKSKGSSIFKYSPQPSSSGFKSSMKSSGESAASGLSKSLQNSKMSSKTKKVNKKSKKKNSLLTPKLSEPNKYSFPKLKKSKLPEFKFKRAKLPEFKFKRAKLPKLEFKRAQLPTAKKKKAKKKN